MPFQEKSLGEIPGRTPDVQIFFHGQLLLRSDDGRICQVAANPLAANHVLTIDARTKVFGKPDMIRMRHVGPLLLRQREGRLIEGMSIQILGTGPPPAAWKCMKVGVPMDYTSGASDPPDEDFRWILNLEGPQFHERTLDVPIFTSHHTIKLKGGEYFFRTAVRSDALMTHKRKDGGKGPVTFRRIGVIACASVFLTDGQSVQLAWQSPALPGESSVTLHKAENTTHEIYINNAPLFLEEPPEGELPQFEELREYYKLITNVPPMPGARFQLVPTIPTRPRDTGSPSIPCQIQRLDGVTD